MPARARRFSCIAVVAGLLAAWPHPGLAQEHPRQLFVTVMDGDGVPIRGLTAGDFAVREDGRDRAVLDVAPLAEPMDVALLLDTSNGLGAGLPALKAAATALIDVLPPEHRIGLYEFGERATLLVGFTDNRREVHEAVQRLFRRETLPRLLDTIDLAARDLRAHEAKRPVIVAITGTGADVSSTSAGSVVKRVAESGVALHVVAVRSNTAVGAAASSRAPTAVPDRSRALTQLDGAAEGDRELTQLLRQGPELSGGSLERLASFEAAASAVARVASRLVTSYRLTYAGTGSRRPRNLQLGVMYEGVTVRATVAPAVK